MTAAPAAAAALGAAALAALGAALAVLAVRVGFLVTTVDGTSMEPGLRSGDRVLVRRTRRVRAGQVVLVRATAGVRDRDLLLKRVAAVPGDRLPAGWGDPDVAGLSGLAVPPGSVVVLGDNRPASWDSRHFGLVPRERLAGVMIRRLPVRPSPGPDPSRRARGSGRRRGPRRHGPPTGRRGRPA